MQQYPPACWCSQECLDAGQTLVFPAEVVRAPGVLVAPRPCTHRDGQMLPHPSLTVREECVRDLHPAGARLVSAVDSTRLQQNTIDKGTATC